MTRWKEENKIEEPHGRTLPVKKRGDFCVEHLIPNSGEMHMAGCDIGSPELHNMDWKLVYIVQKGDERARLPDHVNLHTVGPHPKGTLA